MMAVPSSTHNQRPGHNHIPSVQHTSQGLFIRGQTTQRQTSLPLAPLSKLPEDRLHQDRQVFPWHLSRSYQRTDYTKTDKPSPGTTLEVTRGQTTSRQTSLDLRLFTRGQTTPRQTSLPLAPLSKLPGDRLHQDRQVLT